MYAPKKLKPVLYAASGYLSDVASSCNFLPRTMLWMRLRSTPTAVPYHHSVHVITRGSHLDTRLHGRRELVALYRGPRPLRDVHCNNRMPLAPLSPT